MNAQLKNMDFWEKPAQQHGAAQHHHTPAAITTSFNQTMYGVVYDQPEYADAFKQLVTAAPRARASLKNKKT